MSNYFDMSQETIKGGAGVHTVTTCLNSDVSETTAAGEVGYTMRTHENVAF